MFANIVLFIVHVETLNLSHDPFSTYDHVINMFVFVCVCLFSINTN